MKLNKKQKELLKNNFYVYTTKYTNGEYLTLEAWTNGGESVKDFTEWINRMKTIKNILEDLK